MNEDIKLPFGFTDEAAANIYPSDLAKIAGVGENQAVVPVFSIAVGCPAEKSVPLFTLEQVQEAVMYDRANQAGKTFEEAADRIFDAAFNWSEDRQLSSGKALKARAALSNRIMAELGAARAAAVMETQRQLTGRRELTTLDLTGLIERMQGVVNGLDVAKVRGTATQVEFFKAGARAAISGVNTALVELQSELKEGEG